MRRMGAEAIFFFYRETHSSSFSIRIDERGASSFATLRLGGASSLALSFLSAWLDIGLQLLVGGVAACVGTATGRFAAGSDGLAGGG